MRPKKHKQMVLPFMFQYFMPATYETALKSSVVARRPRQFFEGQNGPVCPELDWCGGAVPAYKIGLDGKKFVTPIASIDQNGRPAVIHGFDHGMPGAIHEPIDGDEDCLPF